MNRPLPPHDETAAYTYQADIYCPACLNETMITDGIAALPPATCRPTTSEQCAGAPAIDRDDTTYDTSEFPKPALLDWSPRRHLHELPPAALTSPPVGQTRRRPRRRSRAPGG